jgi:hypothetical protein
VSVDVERFTTAATALLDRLGERLSATDQDWLRGYLWSGEWGLLADELAATLTEEHTPIGVAERDLLHDLLFSFEPEPADAELHPRIHDRDRVLAALNVVEGPVSGPRVPSPSPPPRSPGR